MKKTKSVPITLQFVNTFCITCEKTHHIQTTLKKDFKIDACSNCHPFYIGTQKFESKAGRMERFRQLEKKSAALQKAKTQKSSLKKGKSKNKS